MNFVKMQRVSKERFVIKYMKYKLVKIEPKEEENNCHSQVCELDPYSIEVGWRLVLYPIITSEVVSVSNMNHTLVVETCNSFYTFKLVGE